MDKNLYRYFFERKMPASMIMVFTDDPESLRRERSNMAAQTRMDPNFVPMVAVSARNNRGRVDMVRLFHTLQEMDYLPVRQEVRERIAAMWGVTPAWQGAPEAFGGLSTQTQQLVVMSRVVEGDQRMFHDKVFPILLEAFGITDWTLELPTPEEKAEATRISFAQQRVSVASQLNQMGFTVRLQDQGANLEEIAFVIEGESVPMTQFQGESQALQIEQTMQQMEQQEQQQQMQQQQQEMMGGASPEGGEEGESEESEEGEPNAMAQAQVAQDEDEDEDENLNDPEPDEEEE
jgi:DNA-binding transcriptional MerR regulator